MKFKTNQTIYYHEQTTNTIFEAKIEDIYESIDVIKLKITGVINKDGNIIPSDTETKYTKSNNIYETIKAAYDAKEKYDNKQMKLYSESIKTIEDLIYFSITHTISIDAGENTDKNAQKVYCQKVKELLNIDIKI